MNKTAEQPLVAIRCITYNHEAYIRDALDGFVMQKTDFPYVAIIHDDASTDRTAEIIKEYAAKYPHIIKPIYETENQYSKRDGSLSRIMRDACIASRAKYIAVCEGDDYWTDPLKLQKQVDFLESHPDYSMVCTNFEVVNEDNTICKEQDNFNLMRNKSLTGIDFVKLLSGNCILTCTTCFKSEVLLTEVYEQCRNKLDYCLFLSSLFVGKIKYFNSKTACYRRVATGQMISNSYNVLKTCDAIQRYFGEFWLNKFEKCDKYNSKKIKKILACQLIIQYKHYRNDKATKNDIRRIFNKHKSLWVYSLNGVIYALRELLLNKYNNYVK